MGSRSGRSGAVAAVVALLVLAGCSGGGAEMTADSRGGVVAPGDGTGRAVAPGDSGGSPGESAASEASADGEGAGAVPEEAASELGEVPAAEPGETSSQEVLPDDALPPGPEGPVVTDPGVNGFEDPRADPLSTFATDVDTASYALARRAVATGLLPDPAGVRVEEFVNAFPQGYEPPAGDALAIHVDGGPSPFAVDSPATLVRVGLQAGAPSAAERPGAALTFLIDVSGSMADEQRLATVQRALSLLASQLRDDDTVAIVTYGDTAEVVLPPTPASDRATLQDTINGLSTQGSTNVEDGLRVAYDLARRELRPGATNRVVLASDGIANVGLTDPDALLGAVAADAAAGIELVTVGVGVEGYHDTLMERLANAGDGSYSYVDSFAEAQRLFVEEFPSVRETVAVDTKVQVAFDPAVVAGYRLIGYENRAVADERFRDDTVAAGAVGAGHSVTALYEVIPHEGAQGPLATVTLRWTDPASREPHEIAAAVSIDDLAATLEEADPHLQLDAVVAQYAEVLRQSHWATADLVSVADQADRLAGGFPDQPAVAEFAGLARAAAGLTAP